MNAARPPQNCLNLVARAKMLALLVGPRSNARRPFSYFYIELPAAFSAALFVPLAETGQHIDQHPSTLKFLLEVPRVCCERILEDNRIQ